jgi:K(+)-stimulated pyrophosphate-energized sodium pump
MNLISLLILPAIISLSDNDAARYAIAAVALVVLLGAVAFSKRATESIADELPSETTTV